MGMFGRPRARCPPAEVANVRSTNQPACPRQPEPKRRLTPEAQRALAEAEERRRLADARARGQSARRRRSAAATGPDPTRYGDWEKGGIASDF